MDAPPRRRFVLAAAALVLAMALGACSSGSSAPAAANDGPSATGRDASTGSRGSGGQGTLEALAFDEGDLIDGEQVVVPADGTDVSDASPTLAFCQFDFPSETAREARHRVQVLDASYAPVATTEAVRYAAGSSAAITELRGAFIDCPEDEPVDIGEGELITYDAFPVDEAELAGLTRDHVGADITATAADGTEETSTMVAQRRGDVLIVVQGTDHDRVVQLAVAAGARLAAADGSAVGD